MSLAQTNQVFKKADLDVFFNIQITFRDESCFFS